MPFAPKRIAPVFACSALAAASLVPSGANAGDEDLSRIDTDASLSLRQPADAPSDAAATPAATDDAAAPAATPAPPPSNGPLLERQRVFGDLWGARTTLEEHGIAATLTLSQFYQHVTTGGNDVGGEYGMLLDTNFYLDTEKVGLWEGGLLNVHMRTRAGRDVLSKAGSLTLPNAPLLFPEPGDYDGTDITGLLYIQSFMDGQLQIIGGKLDAVDLVSMFFPGTLDGGLGGFMNINATASTMPFLRYLTLSQYGTGVIWNDAETKMGKAGFLVLGEHNTTTDWDFHASVNDGVALAAFYRFFWEMGDKPGYFLVWGSTSTATYRQNEAIEVDGIIPPGGVLDTGTDTPWTVAGYFNQVLWQDTEKTRRLQTMVGGSLADDEVSFYSTNIFANLELHGTFAERPNDRAGVGVWYNGLADGFESQYASIGIHLEDLWGIETYYNMQITPAFHLTGDIQVLGADRERNDDAVVLGMRAVINF